MGIPTGRVQYRWCLVHRKEMDCLWVVRNVHRAALMASVFSRELFFTARKTFRGLAEVIVILSSSQ